MLTLAPAWLGLPPHPPAATAADLTSTWDDSDGDWSDATRWDTTDAPNNGAGGFTYDAVINGGVVTLDATIEIDGLDLSYAELTGAGNLTTNGSVEWSGGTFAGSGLWTLHGPSTFGFAYLYGQVENRGDAVFFNSFASGDSNTVWTNTAGATTELADYDLSNDSGQVALLNNQLGATLLVADGNTSSINWQLDNAGLVDVQAGWLNLRRGTSSGTMQVASGATLSLGGFDSAFTVTGDITSAGELQFAGSFGQPVTLAAGSSLTQSGATTVWGPLVTEIDLTLADLMLSDTLSGAGNLTVNGQFDWNGSLLGAGGVTLNAGTSALGGATVERVIDNYGAATFDGSLSNGYRTGTSQAEWHNRAGATAQLIEFDFGNETGELATWHNHAGATIAVNGAELESSYIRWQVVNEGLIDVQSSRLTLYQGSSSGDIQVAAGARLSFTTYDADFTITGGVTSAGEVYVAGFDTHRVTFAPGSTYTPTGLTTIAGDLDFNNTATLAATDLLGGVLGGTGDVTINGPLSIYDGTLTGGGSLAIHGATTLTGRPTLDRVVDHYGTAIFEEGLITSDFFEGTSNGVWNNRSGSSVEIRDLNLSSDAGAATFRNHAGAMLTFAGSESEAHTWQIVNEGLLDVVAPLSGGHPTVQFYGGGRNDGVINIQSGSGLYIGQNSFANAGQITVPASARLDFDGAVDTISFTNEASGVMQIDGTADIEGNLYNAGHILIDQGGSLVTLNTGLLEPQTAFTNTGVLEVSDGSATFEYTSSLSGFAGYLENPPQGGAIAATLSEGTWIAGPGSTITFQQLSDPQFAEHQSWPYEEYPATIRYNQATVVLNGPGSSISGIDNLWENHGTLDVRGGRDMLGLYKQGDLLNEPFQNTGTLRVGAGSTMSFLHGLNSVGGSLQGEGTFTMDAGVAAVSDVLIASGGTLTLNGDLEISGGLSALATGTLLANGTTSVVGGAHLLVASGATLGGSGTLDLADGLITVEGTIAKPVRVTGPLALSGTLADATLDGATVNASGGAGFGLVNCFNHNEIQSGVVNVNGQLIVNDGGTLVLGAGASVLISGNVNMAQFANVVLNGELVSAGDFFGNGTLAVNDGASASANKFTSTGTTHVGKNASVTSNQTADIAGALALDLDAEINVPQGMQLGIPGFDPATLKGGGTVNGNVQASTLSTVQPGFSPGTLTVGGISFADGATLELEFRDATGVAGTDWDLLAVGSDLVNLGTTIDPTIIALKSLDLLDDPGLTSNFDNSLDYAWTVATAGGAITGFDPNTFQFDLSGFQNDLGGGEFSLGVIDAGQTLQVVFTADAAPITASWNAVAGGSFATAANWTPAQSPGGADTAVFDNAGETYTVTFTGHVSNNRAVVRNGDVTFDLGGNVYSLGETSSAGLVVGESSGDSASLTISNGSITSHAGSIGAQSGASGTVLVDGVGAAWTTADLLEVGPGGSGSLVIQAGGVVSNLYSIVGGSGLGFVTVAGGGSRWEQTYDLRIGQHGVGTLLIVDGANVSNRQGNIASLGSGSTGVVTVDGVGSVWDNDWQTFVGNRGDGTLNIQNGGGVLSGRESYIGADSSGVGVANVSGAGSHWTIQGALSAGWQGSGELNVTQGGVVNNTDGMIGRDINSSGVVLVDGAGSLWANDGAIYLGGNPTQAKGTGSLTITNGGSVTATGVTRVYSTGALTLDGGSLTTGSFEHTEGGVFDFHDGQLTIDGGVFDQGSSDLTLAAGQVGGMPVLTLQNNATTAGIQQLRIGDAAAGRLNVASGSDVQAVSVLVGPGVDGDGVLSVAGAGSTLTTPSLAVGSVGDGLVQVSAGGAVTANSTTVGNHSLSTAVATIDGAGSVWDASSSMTVGGSGQGSLAVSGGASVSTPQFNIGGNASGIGDVAVAGDGSSIAVTAGYAVGAFGAGTLLVEQQAEVTAGTFYVGLGATATGNATVTGPGSTLVAGALYLGGDGAAAGGDGTLTIADGGVVTVGAVARVHATGTLNLDSGVLQADHLDNSQGGAFHWNGGTLAVGGYTGNLLQTACTLAAGASAGVMTIAGDYTLGAGGALQVELAGAGGVPGVDFDFYDISGSASLGGLLDLSLLAPYEGGFGQAFDVLTAATIDTTGLVLSDPLFDFSIELGGNGEVLRLTQLGMPPAAWINTAGGDFGVPGNWSPATTPGAQQDVYFDTPGETYTVTFATPAVTRSAGIFNGDVTYDLQGNTYSLGQSGADASLIVGEDPGDDASLTIAGGTLTGAGSTYVGRNAGANGEVLVDGAGTVWHTGGTFFAIGEHGHGSLTVQNGALLNTGQTRLGWHATGSATVVIDGDDTLWSNGGVAFIGDNGSALLQITGGGRFNSNFGYLGFNPGSTGIVMVDGAGSLWTPNGVYVGGYTSGAGGTGDLTISNQGEVRVSGDTRIWGGGSVTIDGGTLNTISLVNTDGGALHLLDGELIINGGNLDQGAQDLVLDGATPTGAPTLTLLNGASTVGVLDAYIGNANQATLNVHSGDAFESANGYVGQTAGAHGVVNVAGPGSAWNMTGELFVGNGGSGVVNLTNEGAVSSTLTYIGVDTGSTGAVVVDDAQLATTGALDVGRLGEGGLQVLNGGAVTAGDAYLGRFAGATGAISVSGGSSTLATSAIFVGRTGAGELLVDDGADITSGSAQLGVDATAQGEATVRGPGSSWEITGDLRVGSSGAGTLLVDQGAEVNVQSGGSYNTFLGYAPGSTGTVTVDGNGSQFSMPDDTYVGYEGDGMLNITGGGVALSLAGTIARLSGSTGAVTVDGEDSQWDVQQTLYVGRAGSGSLGIAAGGSVSTDLTYIGYENGVTADVSVAGVHSRLSATTDIGVGYNGEGSLTIASGAGVTTNQAHVGWQAGSTGTLSVDGAGSSFTASATAYFGSYGAATIEATNGGILQVQNGLATYLGRQATGSGHATVTGVGSQLVATGNLRVGDSGIGTLTVTNGGSVLSGEARIATASGATGVALIDGAGSIWSSTSHLFVGYGGDGTLNVTGAGVVAPSLTVALGTFTGAHGQVTVDGAGSTLTTPDVLSVGVNGSADLAVLNGGMVSSGQIRVGVNSGGSGAVLVDGVGSLWTTTDSLYLGGSAEAAGGVGTLSISNDAVVAVANETRLWGGGDALTVDGGALHTGSFTRVGASSFDFHDGEVTIDGGAFQPGSVSFYINGQDPADNPTLTLINGATAAFAGTVTAGSGTNDQGALHLLSGGALASSEGRLGNSAGSSGIATVDGAGSAWDISNDLYVGNSGAGALTISAGGAVSNDNALIGSNSPSTGAVTVDGLGSTWTNTGQLTVGGQGVGSLTLSNGGNVSSASGDIAFANEATVTVTGDGSTWDNTGSLNVGVHAEGLLNIDDGGAVNAGGQLNIGDAFRGYLNLTSGGQLTSTLSYIGNQHRGAAIVNGVGSHWLVQDSLHVGHQHDGSLTVSGGGAVESQGDVFLATDPGTQGTLAATGVGSTFQTVEPIHLGNGAAHINVTDGASVAAHSYRTGDGAAQISVIGEGSTLSGFGVLLGFGSTPATLTVASGGLVSTSSVLRVDKDSSVHLASGSIATDVIDLSWGTVSGFGDVHGSLSSSGPNSLIEAAGGVLSIGRDDKTDGFHHRGELRVTSPTATVEIRDADLAQLGPSTTLNGGALVVRNGGYLEAGDTLTGHGVVVGPITGPGFNGVASAPAGTVDFRGTLDVGADTATFYSQGRPTLNGTLIFSGGGLVTPTDSLLLAANGVLEGYADLAGNRVLADTGSTIKAGFMGAGTLSVGDANRVDGFYSNGAIEIASDSTLVLHDANGAVLDSAAYVSLGGGATGGTLVAPNGLTLDFGANLIGHGTVDTNNDIATPLINNGHIAGDSLAEPITLTGYVKGVGSLTNVVITGTDAPGFSPATVVRGSVAYHGVLQIELGGTSAGSFDRIDHLLGQGVAQLGGELDVTLIGGFTPSAGDTFAFLTADDVQGTFDTVSLPTLSGLDWSLAYDATGVVLSVVSAILPGDYNGDNRVDALDYAVWREHYGAPDESGLNYAGNGGGVDQGDLQHWLNNYGSQADPGGATPAAPEPGAASGLALLLALGAIRGRSPYGRCRA